MARTIVLTGGGTAGHVNPNIALIPGLRDRGYGISYIGSETGIENRLIKSTGIDYYSISTGKLRRYFSLRNLTDPFRVLKGIGDAKALLKKLSPDIIFSKGGFVSVPVVMAAKKLGIPVIIHESDATPGLANRISFKYSDKICASFPETIKLLPEDKAVLTGTPIRSQLLTGDKDKGLSFAGFTGDKPLITIMGGSIGAVYVNNIVRQTITKLTEQYNVVHLCGKGNLDESLMSCPGYRQYEYLSEELSDVLAATELIISRAGANAIFEILALRIPNILIPLPGDASRGDQIINANSFAASGYSYVLLQENLNSDSLISCINDVLKIKNTYINAMSSSEQKDAVSSILDLIDESVKTRENN